MFKINPAVQVLSEDIKNYMFCNYLKNCKIYKVCWPLNVSFFSTTYVPNDFCSDKYLASYAGDAHRSPYRS
jgi:hypothetical protein